MNNEIHSSYKQSLIHRFFLLYMFRKNYSFIIRSTAVFLMMEVLFV
jgi:hypothetical protein